MSKVYRKFSTENESLPQQESFTVVFESISNIDSETTQEILNDSDKVITALESISPLQFLKQNNDKLIYLVVEERWADKYTELIDKYDLSNCDVIITEDSKNPEVDTTDIRESYIDNKVFSIGDCVFEHSTGLYAEIIDRGSNYVRVVNQLGEVNRCWLDTITECQDVVVFDEADAFYKGNDIPAADELVVKQIKESLQTSEDVYKSIQEVRSMNFLDTPYNTFIDQQRLARMFATVLGLNPTFLPQDPKVAVELALLKLPGLVLSPRGWDMVSIFLEKLDTLKIKYNRSYLNAVKQHLHPSLFVKKPVSEEVDDFEDQLHAILDKFEADPAFLEDEINSLSFEDIEHLYDEESEKVDEAISYNERIARSLRFKRLQPILQRRRQLALSRASNPEVARARARKMAISMIKKRLLQGRANVPPSEKARIENVIKMRRNLINRTTTKLVPKIKALERGRFVK